jgi:hypothetical protein
MQNTIRFASWLVLLLDMVLIPAGCGGLGKKHSSIEPGTEQLSATATFTFAGRAPA